MMFSQCWWIIVCGYLIISVDCSKVQSSKQNKPSVSDTSFGSDDSDPFNDDGWVEIDDQGFPISSSPTERNTISRASNPVPNFIQALTTGELGPKPPYQVLRSSDGSVVYLVPGRRPMDRILTEQDLTMSEIFRLFDRINGPKAGFGPGRLFARELPFPRPPPLPLSSLMPPRGFPPRGPLLFIPPMYMPRFPAMLGTMTRPNFGVSGPRMPPVQQLLFPPPRAAPRMGDVARSRTPKIGAPTSRGLLESENNWLFNRSGAQTKGRWPSNLTRRTQPTRLPVIGQVSQKIMHPRRTGGTWLSVPSTIERRQKSKMTRRNIRKEGASRR